MILRKSNYIRFQNENAEQTTQLRLWIIKLMKQTLKYGYANVRKKKNINLLPNNLVIELPN